MEGPFRRATLLEKTRQGQARLARPARQARAARLHATRRQEAGLRAEGLRVASGRDGTGGERRASLTERGEQRAGTAPRRTAPPCRTGRDGTRRGDDDTVALDGRQDARAHRPANEMEEDCLLRGKS